jgi:hypothetical protein
MADMLREAQHNASWSIQRKVAGTGSLYRVKLVVGRLCEAFISSSFGGTAVAVANKLPDTPVGLQIGYWNLATRLREQSNFSFLLFFPSQFLKTLQ